MSVTLHLTTLEITLFYELGETVTKACIMLHATHRQLSLILMKLDHSMWRKGFLVWPLMSSTCIAFTLIYPVSWSNLWLPLTIAGPNQLSSPYEYHDWGKQTEDGEQKNRERLSKMFRQNVKLTFIWRQELNKTKGCKTNDTYVLLMSWFVPLACPLNVQVFHEIRFSAQNRNTLTLPGVSNHLYTGLVYLL